MKMLTLFCMLFTMCMSYANNSVSEDKLEVLASFEGGCDRFNEQFYISAELTGHNLTVYFPQSLGEVTIMVTTDLGEAVSCWTLQTPTGYQLFVQNAGSYIITFTLSNGSQYYAEFEIAE